jgi:hypothetical protein
MQDKPEGIKGCLFVMFALFVVMPLGSFLVAGLFVSGERSVDWLRTGASSTKLVAGLLIVVALWLLVVSRKKARAPKCPQCLGIVNVEAIKCVNCGSKLSG